MFTGIVEEIGRVQSLDIRGKGGKLVVCGDKTLNDIALGDSLAVDGLCLTVESIKGKTLCLSLMPETIRNTIVGHYKKGSPVHLERALQEKDRLGGHIVQGHIDYQGILIKKNKEGAALRETFRVSEECIGQLVSRGSIAINGVSLSLADLKRDSFTVSLVGFTLRSTNLSLLHPLCRVNIETDILGRARQVVSQEGQNKSGKISRDFLYKNGF